MAAIPKTGSPTPAAPIQPSRTLTAPKDAPAPASPAATGWVKAGAAPQQSAKRSASGFEASPSTRASATAAVAQDTRSPLQLLTNAKALTPNPMEGEAPDVKLKHAGYFKVGDGWTEKEVGQFLHRWTGYNKDNPAATNSGDEAIVLRDLPGGGKELGVVFEQNLGVKVAKGDTIKADGFEAKVVGRYIDDNPDQLNPLLLPLAVGMAAMQVPGAIIDGHMDQLASDMTGMVVGRGANPSVYDALRSPLTDESRKKIPAAVWDDKHSR